MGGAIGQATKCLQLAKVQDTFLLKGVNVSGSLSRASLTLWQRESNEVSGKLPHSIASAFCIYYLHLLPTGIFGYESCTCCCIAAVVRCIPGNDGLWSAFGGHGPLLPPLHVPNQLVHFPRLSFFANQGSPWCPIH